MTYSISVTITVTPGKLYRLDCTDSVDIYYSGSKVFGSGATSYFVANESVQLIVQSSSAITGSISVTEILRSYYNINDGQGGTLVFHPYINRWTSVHSYIPESMSMASNRFVTFKFGGIYVHDSSTYNNWYGVTYDSVISFPHNEAGNTVKVYDSIALEGSVPDRVHIQTDTPNLQSSDLVAADFRNIEGVWYAPLYRDRLSPNTGSSVYSVNLYKGDKIRGDVAKFQVVYTQPTTLKFIKFIDINFDPSRGQTV